MRMLETTTKEVKVPDVKRLTPETERELEMCAMMGWRAFDILANEQEFYQTCIQIYNIGCKAIFGVEAEILTVRLEAMGVTPKVALEMFGITDIDDDEADEDGIYESSDDVG
jgi:hypothetical protein